VSSHLSGSGRSWGSDKKQKTLFMLKNKQFSNHCLFLSINSVFPHERPEPDRWLRTKSKKLFHIFLIENFYKIFYKNFMKFL
jgi:hypothetical protein